MNDATVTSQPAATTEQCFLHNMRALWRFDPTMAIRVDAVEDDERIMLEPTRSGDWTATMPTPEGRSVHLNSRYDPAEEAKRFAAAVETEGKFCFIVSGMGLGYHVKALYDRLRGDAIIVCSEPSIEVITTALCCVDLAEAIAARRLIILTDADKQRMHDRLGMHNTLIMLGAQFVRHGPSMQVAADAHAAITEAIAEFVTYTRMTLMTLVANARITCKNIAMNLVHTVQTPPIDILRDRFAGDPAVIIAAGPSLSKNIDQLAALKGRTVLCAVQTAIKPLMAKRIVPDFVTTLDFHEMSRRFYDEVAGLESVHLVAEPKVTWHVTDRYPGPMSLLDNSWARLLIGNELGARGGLQAGATVAHLAFYLAVHMGCDPIIFVGQDLGYTGHVFYVPGVEIHQTWQSETNRFCTIEQKEWDRIVRNRPILRRVSGAYGGEIYTDELLFTYLEQFEKDIAAVPNRVINATEGGARIRGTQAMTLAEVADRFCRQAIDPARFAYRETTTWRDPAKLTVTGDELQSRIDELGGVTAMCDELLRLLEELRGMTDDPDRFNRRLVRVDELRTKIQQQTRAYEIVNAANQWVEFRRFSADRRINAEDLSSAERTMRQIERDAEFISGVREAAKDMQPILQGALDRITAAAKT